MGKLTANARHNTAGRGRPAGSFGQMMHGFTMIEVLIVLAIVAILVGIAYPQYGAYVKRTKRSDAHLALLNAAQFMERCRATQFSYANCVLTAGLQESTEGDYAIALNPAPTASSYTLEATAQNTQADDNKCQLLVLNHRGTRSSSPGTAGQDDNQCWN